MWRVLIALAIVGLVARAGDAGRRCKRLPQIVFWSERADLHDDGKWHRATKSGEKTGRLTADGIDRMRLLAGSGAPTTKLVACLDALIADEKSKQATRACAVAKRR